MIKSNFHDPVQVNMMPSTSAAVQTFACRELRAREGVAIIMSGLSETAVLGII